LIESGEGELMANLAGVVQQLRKELPEDALVTEFARVVKELKDLDEAG
jgi:hypothetical protein